MMSGRFGLAVLTDLSASMFVACFMILLIFLSLVQSRREAPRPAVEATQAFAVVRRAVPSSTAMVGLLFDHRHAGDGTSLDLFADRIVAHRGGAASALSPRDAAQALAASGPVRLYVFSNDGYAEALPALQAAGAQWTEMSVPAALRDAAAPETAWSAGFTALEAETDDPQRFRAGLAVLLDAGPSTGRKPEGAAPGATAPAEAAPAGSDLLTRVRAWLAFLASALVPLGACAAVIAIERGRFRRVAD